MAGIVLAQTIGASGLEIWTASRMAPTCAVLVPAHDDRFVSSWAIDPVDRRSRGMNLPVNRRFINSAISQKRDVDSLTQRTDSRWIC